MYFDDDASNEVSNENTSLSLVTPDNKNVEKGDFVIPEYCPSQINCKLFNADCPVS